MLISFTADAGQEIPSGASSAPLSASAAVMPKNLAPPPRLYSASFGMNSGRGLLHEARLMLGAPDQLGTAPDEAEPRNDLKHSAKDFPEVDRSHKGDPWIGLRPTLDGRWREKDGVAKLRGEAIVFGQDQFPGAAGFSPSGDHVPGPEAVASFQPRPAVPAAAGFKAGQAAEPFTTIVAPTPAGAIGRRDYVALIPPAQLESERHCLAQAVYFEARSEPEAGQAAVAQVVLNRMVSGLYPSTICGVVFENRSRRHACQFSFTCEGKALLVRDPASWSQAARVADEVLAGKTWLADIAGATYYHADYVRPRWARALKKLDVIGKHIFYRPKSGQS
jgi:spore germination cell wall hydrolase CwlJ-like protein